VALVPALQNLETMLFFAKYADSKTELDF